VELRRAGGRAARLRQPGPALGRATAAWHHVGRRLPARRRGRHAASTAGEIDRQPLPTTGTTVSPGLPTNIGQDGRGNYTDNGTVSIVDGTIDDLAIWRRSITLDEIVSLFRKGQSGANVQEKDLADSLVAWLPLDLQHPSTVPVVETMASGRQPPLCGGAFPVARSW
jgi:hypothetical protein